MFIDGISLILILYAAWKGWRAGFFSAIISFSGMFIGFFLAMKCSDSVAAYLKTNQVTDARWAGLLAFVLVLIGVWIVLKLIAKALDGLSEAMMMGWLNKTAGLLVFVLLYIILISGVFFFLEKLSVFSKETIAKSLIYPFVQPVAPALWNSAGEWIPWFRETFSEQDRSF
jgi:membrane protein required for colicin V production